MPLSLTSIFTIYLALPMTLLYCFVSTINKNTYTYHFTLKWISDKISNFKNAKSTSIANLFYPSVFLTLWQLNDLYLICILFNNIVPSMEILYFIIQNSINILLFCHTFYYSMFLLFPFVIKFGDYKVMFIKFSVICG